MIRISKNGFFVDIWLNIIVSMFTPYFGRQRKSPTPYFRLIDLDIKRLNSQFQCFTPILG